MAFTVATAKNEITPTRATNPYLAGYGSVDGGRTVFTDTPYEPLWCRAVVIRENGTPHLILSADILALRRAMHQRIRARILALAPWATGDILLQSTHTHNGPALVDALHPFMAYGLTEMDQIRSYSAWLEDAMVKTAQDALTAAETSVTLDYQVASETFAVNRRGLSYAERDVPILVARRSDGRPAAVIFGYGCHPVAAGDQEQYDGDYPSRACSYIESSLGTFAMFLQGPTDDQDPDGTASWTLRDQDGDALGSTVAGAARSAGRALTGPIATQYR